MSENVFFRIIRLSVFIVIILVLVYGYFLQTKGMLMPFIKSSVVPMLIKIISAYGIVILVVMAIFSFGYYCGRRHGSKSG
ncbi:hypothetical protein M3600_21040 [Niallia sp. MER 6]|nr:hypothetical protein [Niallia sp. MER 6]